MAASSDDRAADREAASDLYSPVEAPYMSPPDTSQLLHQAAHRDDPSQQTSADTEAEHASSHDMSPPDTSQLLHQAAHRDDPSQQDPADTEAAASSQDDPAQDPQSHETDAQVHSSASTVVGSPARRKSTQDPDSNPTSDSEGDYDDYPGVRRLITPHQEPQGTETAKSDKTDPITEPPQPVPPAKQESFKYDRGIGVQTLDLIRGRHKPKTKGLFSKTVAKFKKNKTRKEQIQYLGETIHVREYLVKMGQALMLYGAPTHRIEEYLRGAAKQLSIAASFVYIPGAVLISFDDSYSAAASELKLIRTSQTVDLSRLKDVYDIYKATLHHRMEPKDAVEALDMILQRKALWNNAWLILAYAVASAAVGPFAFNANWMDLMPSFLLGGLLGAGQILISPRSDTFTNSFEILAAILTSFGARLFGSITWHGETVFCFAAVAQSSIALILPGYTVLCGAMELQSRNIVSGATRIVYALIYSLFLGFGITVGSLFAGIILKDRATSATTCANPMSNSYIHFVSVPIYVAANLVLNQGRLKQAPMMLLISFAGFQVNYWAGLKATPGNSQISTAAAAAAIGLLANANARYGLEDKINLHCGKHIKPVTDRWHDKLMAVFKAPEANMEEGRLPSPIEPSKLSSAPAETSANASSPKADSEDKDPETKPQEPQGKAQINSLAIASLLPAVFVLVPGGIAFSGSLVAGLQAADAALNKSETTTSQTATGALKSSGNMDIAYNNVAWSVLQVAIGITAGLFLVGTMYYPKGKKRSGLFTF